MALLEVIVALTIFVIAGLSVAVWVRQTLLSVDHARDAVIAVSTASRYLDRMALWPREDLDRHLGARREGPWIVTVDRVTPTIYSVAIHDNGATKALLQTWLYRAIPVQQPQ